MTQFIIFLLIGLFFSWVFKSYRRYEDGPYSQKDFQNIKITLEAVAQSELGLFVALVAKVAKADGRVDALEAELVGNMFDDISKVYPEPSHAREILKAIFNQEKEQTHNLDTIAQQLYTQVRRRDPKQRYQLMAFMVHLSYVDGELSRDEAQMLERIASHLRIEEHALTEMMNQFASMGRGGNTQSLSFSQACNILGVNENDDLSTIKKAYRKLVKQYHPDVITASGASEDYIQEATQKIQKINEAYEFIKKMKS